MIDAWFANEGTTGKLEIRYRDGCWLVAEPRLEDPTKCMIDANVSPNKSGGTVAIEGTVTRFVQGRGDRANYLYMDGVEQLDSPDVDVTKADTDGFLPENNTRVISSSAEKSDTQTSCSSSAKSESDIEQSLHEIAEEKIGDEKLTIEQDEEGESVIGEAKRRAKNQGRDPAIDPRYQDDS